ncbi:outer membrane lipoprotein-sorting protein [Endobacter medicaginis]|uniref:Outer membrane lipoprotein carrier protein LolA n=1 Tax=Endobacter medicaginis TaxID=1181271 RepID=A0A850NM94_9PROT|nr:outer membrane lipoprotein carrier protein LolA [Endobacter medicaginis]MBB3172320.1 outer membrane lipoprotein-sorting protein [Endobacter medicaginis]MCX5474561.1 outer membrane lipoprotein carrier protein LolA [Endobacter medicaginis]NVN30693.1 outer membrane lipoprotein carrier protein LolA [Endobacter medicaginis]
MRRHLLALAGLLALGCATPVTALAQDAALTPADQGWIDRIQDTLNGIHTLKARFQQTAPDGRTSEGTAWLDRPGRMRFQYDAPSPLLLTAANGQVVFQDRQLDQTTNIPLDKTPLGLLLRDHLTLSGDVHVTGFRHANGFLTVTVVRTASPGDGSLTLVFTDNPVSLRGWTVIDAQQRSTAVRLSDVATGGTFPDSLFQPAPEKG